MNPNLFDNPAIVRPADELAELARQIHAEHEAAEVSLRSGLEHARKAGELLLQAKSRCAHGKWLTWLKDNARFSERTAQAYMRVARRWGELAAKAQGLADLTFEDGLKLLVDRSQARTSPWPVMKPGFSYLISGINYSLMWACRWADEAGRDLCQVVACFDMNDEAASSLVTFKRPLLYDCLRGEWANEIWQCFQFLPSGEWKESPGASARELAEAAFGRPRNATTGGEVA
jgi:hypothetical protein